jgi:hypothetical protein
MNIRSERKCSDLDEAAARREAEIYLNEERMTLTHPRTPNRLAGFRH